MVGDERISRGTELQMTVAAGRTDKSRAKIMDRVGTRKC